VDGLEPDTFDGDDLLDEPSLLQGVDAGRRMSLAAIAQRARRR
jgi:hypothetical protein